MQATFALAGNDRLVIGLAAIDDDALLSPMTRERLPNKALGSQQIAMFAAEELDGVARAVDGAVAIYRSTTNLHNDGPLAMVEPLEQQR